MNVEYGQHNIDLESDVLMWWCTIYANCPSFVYFFIIVLETR